MYKSWGLGERLRGFKDLFATGVTWDFISRDLPYYKCPKLL